MLNWYSSHHVTVAATALSHLHTLLSPKPGRSRHHYYLQSRISHHHQYHRLQNQSFHTTRKEISEEENHPLISDHWSDNPRLRNNISTHLLSRTIYQPCCHC